MLYYVFEWYSGGELKVPPFEGAFKTEFHYKNSVGDAITEAWGAEIDSQEELLKIAAQYAAIQIRVPTDNFPYPSLFISPKGKPPFGQWA